MVQLVVPTGHHGPYAVATTEDQRIFGSITFSLEPTVWEEKDWPEAGTVVVLSKLRQKRLGWRAKRARFSKPCDEQSANERKDEKK